MRRPAALCYVLYITGAVIAVAEGRGSAVLQFGNEQHQRLSGGRRHQFRFIGRWFAWRRNPFNRHRTVSPDCRHLSLGGFLVVQFVYYQFTATHHGNYIHYARVRRR
jgi:hypothetical protein